MRCILTVTMLCIGLGLLGSTKSAAQTHSSCDFPLYQVSKITTPASAGNATVRSLSDGGVVMGYTGDALSGDLRPFSWTMRSGYKSYDLGAPAIPAESDRNGGSFVGTLYPTSNPSVGIAYRYKGGALIALNPDSADGVNSEALGMTDDGRVVGYSTLHPLLSFGTPESTAFIYSADANFRDLGSLGGIGARAIDINSRGHILAARSQDSGSSSQIMFSKDGDQWRNISEELAGAVFFPVALSASDAILARQIFVVNTSVGPLRITISTIIKDGRLNPILIPPPSGHTIPSASAFNDSGLVTLNSTNIGNGEGKAFLWSSKCQSFRDLNALIDPRGGYSIEQAVAIDSAGSIVAMARHAGGLVGVLLSVG